MPLVDSYLNILLLAYLSVQSYDSIPETLLKRLEYETVPWCIFLRLYDKYFRIIGCSCSQHIISDLNSEEKF